jgi:DNA-binding NtrC family response regulator
MLEYEWPGNVRELENCIERAMALGSQQNIDIQDLPPAVRGSQPQSQPGEAQNQEPLPATRGKETASATDLEELERDTIKRVFEQVQGDKARARKMLGISRATLYRKLKRYNIANDEKSSSAAS